VETDEADFRAVLDRAQAGDPEAAGLLYARYSAFVRAAVRRKLHPRLRPQFDSADFVQDVWKSFLTGPDRRHFESPQKLIAFLARVARNKVVDVFRTRFETEKANIARERPLGGAAGVPARQPTPSQWAIAGEGWERLVQEFPAAYRVILERLRAGYTYEEIAREAGVSLTTVNRIVRRLKDVTGA
jgi:RNA polymerase sigma factor (sigma-70 family)